MSNRYQKQRKCFLRVCDKPYLILFVALAMAIVNQIWVTVLFYCGIATLDPLALEEEAIVRIHTESLKLKRHVANVHHTTNKSQLEHARLHPHSPNNAILSLLSEGTTIRLPAYDDVALYNNSTALLPDRTTTTWDVFQSDEDITIDQLSPNATSCFAGGSFGAVNCLPSFLILGFEKCGTTVLNIWFSYHPNLLTNWYEGRFFDSLESTDDMNQNWHKYLRSLPKVPGGQDSVSKYWTFDKSPGYATNANAAQAAARLVPNARLLFLTRNPTRRAYSFFLMCTHHYANGQKLSFFAKGNATGTVAYARIPGKGGTLVPAGLITVKTKANTNTQMQPPQDWRYLSYPPDPQDFDQWARQAIRKTTKRGGLKLDNQGRPNRILAGGLYVEYLKQWLHYFRMEQFVIIPTELFHQDTIQSMNQLQTMLRLPLFNYTSITKKDDESGQVDIDSLGTTLNSYVNSYKPQEPMLNTTKELLDAFYCDSNRELSRMLGGRTLPGYSCAEG